MDLTELKGAMRVVVQHQRLLDKGIFDYDAHKPHVFDFRSNALAIIDCFFSGRDPEQLLHTNVTLKLPGKNIVSIKSVSQYMASVSNVRSSFDVNISAKNDRILVVGSKVNL